MRHFTFTIIFILAWVFCATPQNSADFEDLELDTESFWNGSDNSGGFVSGDITFVNDFSISYGYEAWSGFAYSTMSDTLTQDYSNQFSAITGSGIGDTGIYAVAYYYDSIVARLAEPAIVEGIFVTNTAWAYLTMLNGDAFSKKFGGATGDDPDYFRLSVFGIGEEGDTTGTVLFYLADFRAEDPDDDYIIKTWEWVDLTDLGEVSELRFRLESTDMSVWGMNTPAYFCIDNFNIPAILTSGRQQPANFEIKAYPNPFTHSITVSLPEGSYSVYLRELTGRIVHSSVEYGNNKVTINGLDSVPPGMYLLTVYGRDEMVYTVKLLKHD